MPFSCFLFGPFISHQRNRLFTANMGEWSERTLMGNWCEERRNKSVPAQGAVVPPYGLALKLVRISCALGGLKH
jgi:hypothetical protein